MVAYSTLHLWRNCGTCGGVNMQKNMDTIQFNYRSEVGNIEQALCEWLETHSQDEKARDVKELIDLLDVMGMTW